MGDKTGLTKQIRTGTERNHPINAAIITTSPSMEISFSTCYSTPGVQYQTRIIDGSAVKARSRLAWCLAVEGQQ